jgi:hypothetical protein
MRSYLQLAVTVLVVLVVLGSGGHRGDSRLQAREDVRVSQALFTDQSALNASGVLGQPYAAECREFAVYIIWGAGTSAGGVTIESATTSTYTGTWAPVTTAVAWSAASKQDLVSITGAHMNLRARISTLVTGGTVSTWVTCN